MQSGADDYLTKPSTAEEFLSAIATQLEKRETLRQLYAERFQQPSSTPEPNADLVLPATSNPQLQEVFAYIEAHYHESISLIDVATAVGYSSAYLTDFVKRQTGITINRWIIKRRLAAAESLLKETNNSIEQIAEEIGYLNPGHFFRQFRQYVGTTPKVWRKTHRGY
jgi:YesN/AraC family two-component response regulator